jgi:hypothetical protein
MMMKYVVALLLLAFIPGTGNSQYVWEKLAYYHSTGTAPRDIAGSYQIELNESGSGKLEYTKYGKTNIYEFEAGKKSLKELNRIILSGGVLEADTNELRGSKEFTGLPVYLITIFLDKPEGYKKRKHPVVIIQSDVSDKYRKAAFNIYEQVEAIVPKTTWEQAFADAEKNSGS